MADKDSSTPRVYLFRHGETEWTISGRYTGVSEVPLTANGEQQVLSTGRVAVGRGKLVDPARVARVFVSPRKRARTTFDLLFRPGGAEEGSGRMVADSKVQVTADISEWGYGAYEGLLTEQIRARRKAHGLDRDRAWDIWRDGCEGEGGESPGEVTERLDRLIETIREMQRPNMHGEAAADVVLVAHGHILRAFVKRWLGYPMETPLHLMMSPGAVGVLSYANHRVENPALMVGVSLPVQ
ncbi:hypothetical protein DV737_g1854, partial [Chaetothyriales sp. CBS 132003]